MYKLCIIINKYDFKIRTQHYTLLKLHRLSDLKLNCSKYNFFFGAILLVVIELTTLKITNNYQFKKIAIISNKLQKIV